MLNRKNTILISVFVLVILGLLMIYLGWLYAPKVMIPPIVTGIGFFVIAWALNATNKKSRTGKY